MRALLGVALVGTVVSALASADADVESKAVQQGPAEAGEAAASSVCGPYRICAGDTIFVSVDGEELFTKECQVNGAGTISYPMLGDVEAANATCAELGARRRGVGRSGERGRSHSQAADNANAH